jgi:hypothetical protein
MHQHSKTPARQSGVHFGAKSTVGAWELPAKRTPLAESPQSAKGYTRDWAQGANSSNRQIFSGYQVNQ